MDRAKAIQFASVAFRRAVLGLWCLGAIVALVWPA
jgi:hypothetical protein